MSYNNSMLFGPEQSAAPDWDAYRARARAGVQGVNQMPGVLSNYAGLAQMAPEEILRLLFPQAGNDARIGLAGGRPYPRQSLPAPSGSASSRAAQELSALKEMMMLKQGPPDLGPFGPSTLIMGGA